MKSNLKSANGRDRRAARVAGWTTAAAMLALSGCYMFSSSQAQEDKLQTQLHFNLAQCQQVEANLYKCPGVDRSVCGAFYAGQDVTCLKLDKDGNALVQKTQ